MPLRAVNVSRFTLLVTANMCKTNGYGQAVAPIAQSGSLRLTSLSLKRPGTHMLTRNSTSALEVSHLNEGVIVARISGASVGEDTP